MAKLTPERIRDLITDHDALTAELEQRNANEARLSDGLNAALAQVAALREALDVVLRLATGQLEYGYKAWQQQEVIHTVKDALADTAKAATEYEARIREDELTKFMEFMSEDHTFAATGCGALVINTYNDWRAK